MRGSARVNANNEIYLDTTESRTIEIDGAFTGTDTIAKIHPAAYSNNYTVLSASGGNTQYIIDFHSRFAVTPDMHENWKIDSVGKLEKIP